MNAVSCCPCRQNDLNNNAPKCQFVRIYDKLPECPCSCIPSINAGPPCPFKSPAPCMPSPVQCILQADQNVSQGCPLSSGIGNVSSSPSSDQSQLCVFAQEKPINFKQWPQHQCKCVPSTCPEIAKNLLRSWGFDPMCFCPCPATAAAALATATSEIEGDGAITKGKSRSQQKISKTNLKSAGQSASKTDLAGVKENRAPDDNETAGVEGSPTKLARDTPKPVVSIEITDTTAANDDGPPGGKLITRGRGFTIYEIDGEKVLFNYLTKNCKYLKCECSKKKEESCGCDEWQRMTKYRNCCCPGAKKQRAAKPAKAIVKDLRPSQEPEQQLVAPDERKGVKYSSDSKLVSKGTSEVSKDSKSKE